jgi:type II restriction enzyme
MDLKMYSFNTLKSTFQDSIFTWDYFTDFEKVKQNIRKVEKELNLLNYLIGKENIEDEFIKLVREYPRVRTALPLLIAVRADKLRDMPIISDMVSLIAKNKSDIFYSDTIDEKELLVFFRSSGIKDILQNKNVKNLVDYCFGVEVGMDTNARKNRTGTLMENLVGKYLDGFCQKHTNYEYTDQATKDKIKQKFGYEIKIDKNSRRFDFALYDKAKNKLFLIEVNYYGGGGSKLKATAGEYQYLNDFLKEQGLTLIWITDGTVWLTALRPLEETFNHNEHVLNIEMLKNGVFEKIVIN